MAISLVTLGVFAFDKAMAKRPGARRVPERTLHLLSVLGGFAGAIVGMVVVRHKNRKVGFWVVALGCAVVHVGVWVFAIVQ